MIKSCFLDPMTDAHQRQTVIPFKPGDITFNKDYNTHFTPWQFKIPSNVSKVYKITSLREILEFFTCDHCLETHAHCDGNDK